MTIQQARKIRHLNRILRAVRQRCLDCSAYNPHEVRMCVMTDCPLYPYRTGKIISSQKILCKNHKTKQKQAILEGFENE